MVKKSQLIKYFISLQFLVLFSGCASYTQETIEMRNHFKSNRYKAALESLEKSDMKNQERNRLLYQLEKGMIYYRMGDSRKAREAFIAADKIVDDLYTTSISKTAVTFIYNDSASDYAGEDYEKVAIHTMLALSFLEENNLKSARVSAKKINNKLHEINQNYKENKNSYNKDAFALYLSGLIFEAKGDIDDAILDYKKALKLYEKDYLNFYSGKVPQGLVEGLYKLALKRGRKTLAKSLKKKWSKYLPSDFKQKIKGTGELVVIHEVGHIAVKQAVEFMFGAGSQLIRFSFPMIRSYRSNWGKSGVEVKGQGFTRGDNVQDMDAIAEVTLTDRKGRMIVKNASRLLIKGQIAEQARQKLGILGGLAANAYNAISETADTRGWTLLPKRFYITRVFLKPGKHEINIQSAGRLDGFESIKVKKGEMQFIVVHD